MEHNLKILQDLDKKYWLIAITRPKMRFHRPQETSVYRNNFYHISFNKRYTDNNRETDEILPLMQNLSQSKYVAQRTIARPMASYPDDPLKSHMRYFDEIEVPEAWEAIENYNQWHVVVGLIEWVNSHPDLPGWFAWSSDHGTHTAGSIAAITNNGIGVPAISNNNATLLVSPWGWADCPACRDSALDSVSSASIVSVSQLAGFWLKNSSNAKYLEDIIRWHNNTLFLMAAGNENLNPDTDYGRGWGQYCCRPSDGAFNAFPWTRGIYPGELGRNSYGLNNFITVAASTTNASKASFSCYGDRISLASPGTSILSTVPWGWYQARGGTSMATPVAASFATLLKALDSSLSASALKWIMQDTADPISRAWGAWRINVCQGVAALNYPCWLAQENCSGTSDTNGDGEIWCEDPTCAVRKDVTDKKVCEWWSVQIDATTPRATTYLREHWPTTPIIKVTPTQTTIYKVKITNVHSCSKTISIKVETKASSPEICNDWYDNDCNEKTDCADPTCSNNSSCQSPSPTPPNPGMFRPKAEKCDGDRDTCKRNEWGEKFCTDGIDNDDNGEIDCADSNCRCMSICGTKECNCCDEIDNDGNGKIDCKSGKEDSECDCDKTSFSTQQETIPIQKSWLRPNFENTNLTQFDL